MTSNNPISSVDSQSPVTPSSSEKSKNQDSVGETVKQTIETRTASSTSINITDKNSHSILESMRSIKKFVSSHFDSTRKIEKLETEYKDAIAKCLGEDKSYELIRACRNDKKILEFFCRKGNPIAYSNINVEITPGYIEQKIVEYNEGKAPEEKLDLEKLNKLPLHELRKKLNEITDLKITDDSTSFRGSHHLDVDSNKLPSKDLIKLEPFVQDNPILRVLVDQRIKHRREDKIIKRSDNAYFENQYGLCIDDSKDRSLYNRSVKNKRMHKALVNIYELNPENKTYTNLKDALRDLKHKDVPLMQEMAKNCIDENIKNALLNQSFEILADKQMDNEAFVKKHLKAILGTKLKKSTLDKLVHDFQKNDKIIDFLKNHLLLKEKLKYQGFNYSPSKDTEGKIEEDYKSSKANLSHYDKAYLKVLIQNLPGENYFKEELKELLNEIMFQSPDYSDIATTFRELKDILDKSSPDPITSIKTLSRGRTTGNQLLKKIDDFESYTYLSDKNELNSKKIRELSKLKHELSELLFLKKESHCKSKEEIAKDEFKKIFGDNFSLRPKVDELKTFVYSYVMKIVKEQNLQKLSHEELASKIRDYCEVTKTVKTSGLFKKTKLEAIKPKTTFTPKTVLEPIENHVDDDSVDGVDGVDGEVPIRDLRKSRKPPRF